MTNVSSEDIKALIEIFDESDWRDLALQVEDFRIFLSRDSDADWSNWLGARTNGAAQGNGSMQGASAANTPPTPAPAQAAAPATSQAEVTPADSSPPPENAVAVRASNLGIFYRSPKPGAAPYVQLGDQIEVGTEICLIEVMKLFTPVTSEVGGKICKICVEDGELIEHNQPLFYIEPAG